MKGEVFGAANPTGAKRLIITIQNLFEADRIILQAKAVNPEMTIIVRAHSGAEVDHLKDLGADQVIMGEHDIASGIIERVLHDAPKAALLYGETKQDTSSTIQSGVSKAYKTLASVTPSRQNNTITMM